MNAVLADVGAIREATLPVHPVKYDLVRETVPRSGPPMDRIEVVYLSPAHPAPDREDVTWIPLERFASKSRFCSGLQCPKQLWWRVHEPEAPELEAPPGLQAVFDRGHRVGEAARERFPGGVPVGGEYWEVEAKVEQTRRALADGATVVYEASFLEDGVFVAVDVLERRRGGFRLHEVKSTLDVKEPHLADVAIQLHVLRRAGVDARRATVMHLNRDCRYPDLSDLFVCDDVTRQVEPLLPAIPRQVRNLQRMLVGPLPDVDVGEQCAAPYECPFAGRCMDAPEQDDVTQLYGLRTKRVAELLDQGIHKIDALPEDLSLPGPARRQVASLRSGKLVVEAGLAEALTAINPPISFLDFETVMPAIPAWSGCAPYGQVPVQISCHVLGARGGLTHHQHLADSGADPRQALAEAVVSACRGAATVVAYNASFERRCLADLAAAVPRLRRELRSVSGRRIQHFGRVARRIEGDRVEVDVLADATAEHAWHLAQARRSAGRRTNTSGRRLASSIPVT